MSERNPAFRQGGIEDSLSARLSHIELLLQNTNTPLADDVRVRLQNEQVDLLSAINELGPDYSFVQYHKNSTN